MKKFTNDEDMITMAAKGCYYPPKSIQQHAMAMIIERLVLPEELNGYQEEEMAKFIKQSIEKGDK